jgi:hypothetical protein
MRLIILAAAALSVAACAPMTSRVPIGTAPPMDADLGAPSVDEAGYAAARTAAAIADALGAAPPATLTRTTIDEKAIRLVFVGLDNTRALIDGALAGGMIVRNSPMALNVQRALIQARTAVNVASSAQRAGNATTYVAALNDAEAAVRDLRAALAR